MIRPLRSVHRVVFLVAAVALPALLVAGVRARRPLPLAPVVPLPVVATVAPPLIWNTSAGTTTVTLVGPGADSSSLEVELAGAPPLRGPDLLLYWTSRRIPVEDLDSADALLGAVAAQPVNRYRMPRSVQPGQGSLLLFSLAHHAVLGATAMPSWPR